MSDDAPANPIQRIRQLGLALLGANLTFLAVTLAELPNRRPSPFVPGWYGVFVVLTIATITPAVFLLAGSDLRKVALQDRAGALFSFLALQWVIFLALGFKTSQMTGVVVAEALAPWLIVGAALAVVYALSRWWLRRPAASPEGMFP